MNLYIPDCKNEPKDIEQIRRWNDFMQEHCTGLIDIENVTVESMEHCQFMVLDTKGNWTIRYVIHRLRIIQ